MLVYKYLSPERIGFLSDGLVRFTPPGELNDPFECLPALPENLARDAVKRIRQRIEESFEFQGGDDRNARRLKQTQCKRALANFDAKIKREPTYFRDEFFKTSGDRINKGLGVLSLSSRWNSALMWSHYTSSYQGFCVGFDKEHDFFRGVPDKSGDRQPISAVVYSRERILIKGDKLDKGDPDRLLFTKSKDWEYEQEERMLAFFEFANKTIPQKPYPISLFKIPDDAIVEIIIGSRASKDLRDFVFEAADRLRAPVYETKVSDMSFDVERRLVRR